MNFLNNKYTKWYWKIINNPDTRAYTESHHIIPKSLGGTDNEINLVSLSLRQHFVVHLLLPRMLKGTAKNKMLFALRCMINFNRLNRRYKPSSRIIEMMKINIRSLEISDEHRQNISNAQIGKKLSTAHRAAISKGLVGRIQSSETRAKIAKSNLGLKRSYDTKIKISKARKGTKPSILHRQNIGNSLRGRKTSDKTRMSIKKSQEKFIYTITSLSSAETFSINNLKDWCTENKLPYSSFSEMSRKGGIVKGWKISRQLLPDRV